MHGFLGAVATGMQKHWHLLFTSPLHAAMLLPCCQSSFALLCCSHDLLTCTPWPQVYNVCTSPIVQNAWAEGQQLAVHCLVYSVSDGILRVCDGVAHLGWKGLGGWGIRGGGLAPASKSSTFALGCLFTAEMN